MPTHSSPNSNANISTFSTSANRQPLNICHVNIRSLNSNFCLFKEFFRTHSFDIIAVSETWLNFNMSDAQFKLPSFTLFRNYRTNRTGGGVALYIKNTLRSKFVLSSTYLPNHPEYLFLEVWHTRRQKILIGVAYNPPTSESLNLLEADLDDIMPHYKHVILIGDFNINMNSASLKSDCLMEFYECLGLHLLNYGNTHHTAHSDSWIDHCLVSDWDSVLNTRQSSEPFLADHDLISLQYDYNIPSAGRRRIWCRNWARIDETNLQRLCLDRDISNIDSAVSVDNMNDCLHQHLGEVIEAIAPIRETVIRDQPAPWINQDIRTLQRRRSKLYRIYRRSGFAFKEYANLRKVIKSKILEAKKNYFVHCFSNCKNAKSCWNDFRNLGLVKSTESNAYHDIDIDELNNYFVSVGSSFSGIIDYNYISRCLIRYETTFEFKKLDCDDVKKGIMRLTSSSKGPDSFDIKTYKILLPYFLESITDLFNRSLSSEYFPSIWKQSYVLPIPKIRTPTGFSDYRPISLTCTLSKSLERCVHDQIMNYLTVNGIIDDYQTGFREGLNAQDAILRLC